MHKTKLSIQVFLTCLAALLYAQTASAACCSKKSPDKNTYNECCTQQSTKATTIPPCRPAASAPCYVVGGNREFCESEPEERLELYEWRLEHQCYAEYGICERDASGQCGWRRTTELLQCIGNMRNEIAESIEPCGGNSIKKHITAELPPK